MSAVKFPDQINSDLFKRVLESKFKRDVEKFQSQVEILNFEVSMGSRKGDNYASEIFRAKVEYKVNGKIDQISLILKYIPDRLEDEKNILDALNAIEKEKEVYDEILVKMSEILGEKLAAECYYVSKNPTIFVFEDLKVSGYKLADGHSILNLDHCKTALETLGKFHASSYVLAEKFPKIYENFSFGLYRDCTENPMFDIAASGLRLTAEVAKEWKGFESIVQKMEKIADNFKAKMLKCLNQASDLKVLNHGDIWTNNIMFSYDPDSGRPKDAVFVDFQIPVYSSLGYDYSFFISVSPIQEVRDGHKEDLFQVYYESLAGTMKKLNYPNIPSIEKVRDEIERFEFVGFSIAVSDLAHVLYEKGDDFFFGDYEEMQNSESFKKLMYSNEKFQNAIKPMLVEYNRIGVLDL